MRFTIEYGPNSRFRIHSPFLEYVGEWAAYDGIATLKLGDTVWAALSPYYEGGDIPPNRIFKVDTKSTFTQARIVDNTLGMKVLRSSKRSKRA